VGPAVVAGAAEAQRRLQKRRCTSGGVGRPSSLVWGEAGERAGTDGAGVEMLRRGADREAFRRGRGGGGTPARARRRGGAARRVGGAPGGRHRLLPASTHVVAYNRGQDSIDFSFLFYAVLCKFACNKL
jgi:hypothetical protein